MILKFESREFITDNFSYAWRLNVDIETGKVVGVLLGIDMHKGNVHKVTVYKYKTEWNSFTDRKCIRDYYENKFFQCEGRFTPIKGLKRCSDRQQIN
jgi:hypothetical protein